MDQKTESDDQEIDPWQAGEKDINPVGQDEEHGV
jgi:hypothetical protein